MNEINASPFERQFLTSSAFQSLALFGRFHVRWRPAIERYWLSIDFDPSGCWLWTGAIEASGYGIVSVAGRLMKAHRLSFFLHRGAIPIGKEPDHLCRVRRCVHPYHLEPVTHRENMMRGNSLQAHNANKAQCEHGHPFDEEDTRFNGPHKYRSCRTCDRLRSTRGRRRWGIPQRRQHGY